MKTSIFKFCCIIFLLSTAIFSGPAVAQSDGHGTPKPTLLTKKKSAVIHREQEGLDTTYKTEISLLTDLSFMNKKFDSQTTAESNIEVRAQWLFIIGSFEIGPDIGYETSKTSATVTSQDQTTGNASLEIVETTTSTYAVGGLFKWNFADIDHALLVPFAYVGMGYRASETKLESGDPVKSSGSVMKVGGGLNVFLDSNVALNPRAEYRIETDRAEDDKNALDTTTSGFKILVGIATFI